MYFTMLVSIMEISALCFSKMDHVVVHMPNDEEGHEPNEGNDGNNNQAPGFFGKCSELY